MMKLPFSTMSSKDVSLALLCFLLISKSLHDFDKQ